MPNYLAQLIEQEAKLDSPEELAMYFSNWQKLFHVEIESVQQQFKKEPFEVFDSIQPLTSNLIKGPLETKLNKKGETIMYNNAHLKFDFLGELSFIINFRFGFKNSGLFEKTFSLSLADTNGANILWKGTFNLPIMDVSWHAVFLSTFRCLIISAGFMSNLSIHLKNRIELSNGLHFKLSKAGSVLSADYGEVTFRLPLEVHSLGPQIINEYDKFCTIYFELTCFVDSYSVDMNIQEETSSLTYTIKGVTSFEPCLNFAFNLIDFINSY